MRVAIVGVLLAVFGTAEPASAQEPINVAVQVTELWRIFKDLYGPNGLVVNSNVPLASGATHSSHFNSGFESEFSQFGTALTSQIVSLPLPPPASGFTYQFDPGLGVFSRTTTSFGPILSERAETIGARRVSVGFAYQRLSFDSIEGVDLRQRAGRVHARRCEPAGRPRGRRDDDQRDRGGSQSIGGLHQLRRHQQPRSSQSPFRSSRPISSSRPTRRFNASARRILKPTSFDRSKMTSARDGDSRRSATRPDPAI